MTLLTPEESATVKVWQPKNLSKYRSKATFYRGIRFDSRLEATRYIELETKLNRGLLSDLYRQFPVNLGSGVVWLVDFVYSELTPTGWRVVYEEVKAVDQRTGKRRWTEAGRIKYKLGCEKLAPAEVRLWPETPAETAKRISREGKNG